MASPNQSRRSRVIEGMAIWGSYYRENIDMVPNCSSCNDGQEPNVPVDCCPRNG